MQVKIELMARGKPFIQTVQWEANEFGTQYSLLQAIAESINYARASEVEGHILIVFVPKPGPQHLYEASGNQEEIEKFLKIIAKNLQIEGEQIEIASEVIDEHVLKLIINVPYAV